MREGTPVTMVMATEGTRSQVQLEAIIHVYKSQPLQKTSGGEVDLALFRPAYSDNTMITLDYYSHTRASLTFRPSTSCSVISLLL